MFILISIVHVIVCLVLVLVILLQAGRGGGLSEMFGGAMTQSEKLFGTETNVFLTRATSTCAILFVLTSITLGLLTTNRSKSLLAGRRIAPIFAPVKEAAKEAEAVPAAADAQGRLKPPPPAAAGEPKAAGPAEDAQNAKAAESKTP